MNGKMLVAPLGLLFLLASFGMAEEVNKGAISAAHLDKATKTLPWNAAIWDNEEAIPVLKGGAEEVLWVDTRPVSFFKNGTVKNAVLLVYDKTGATYQAGDPVLTEESLKKAIADFGVASDQVKIVFFCQGPKCHRSYNASYKAITDWGFPAEQIIWYRDGYPVLLTAVRNDPKLKRRAKKYLSDSALDKI